MNKLNSASIASLRETYLTHEMVAARVGAFALAVNGAACSGNALLSIKCEE
jgi:hypothetical protein